MTKKKSEAVRDQPIVFFLRVPEVQETVTSPEEYQSYSDIIQDLDNSSNRFNNDILKPILASVCNQTEYSKHVHCFWCCHEIPNQTFTLPVSYDTNKMLYNCTGVFCAPECALAYLYADVNTTDSSKWNRHSLLKQLYHPLYEEKEISVAPPRSLLRNFGGPLDIKQFREYTSNTGDIVLSELPPIRMLIPTMNIQGPLRDIKRYVSISNDTVDKASEALRLKRTKPSSTNILTLDMCIKH